MDRRADSAGGSDAAPQVPAPPNGSRDLLPASRLTQLYSEPSTAAVHRSQDPSPGPHPASRLMQLFSAPSTASTQPPQAPQPSPLHLTLDTTPSGSLTRLTEASMAQHGEQQPPAVKEPPTTPETASSGSSHRSASDDTPTAERGAPAAQNEGSAAVVAVQSDNAEVEREQEKEAGGTGDQDVEDRGAAIGRVEPKEQQALPQKMDAMWYNQLPQVLDKIKMHGQEQIKGW
jgi:hypothetical protein